MMMPSRSMAMVTGSWSSTSLGLRRRDATPAKLLDDRGAVELAVAGGNRAVEDRCVSLRQREDTSEPCCGVEHQRDILAVLPDSRLGGRIVAADHFFALGIDRPRICWGHPCHGEERSGVETERFGEYEALRERGAVQPKQQIGGEFRPVTAARRSQMKRVPGNRIENRGRVVERAALAPGNGDGVSGAYLNARSGQGRIDQMHAAIAERPGERGDAIGIIGADVDQDCAGTQYRR